MVSSEGSRGGEVKLGWPLTVLLGGGFITAIGTASVLLYRVGLAEDDIVDIQETQEVVREQTYIFEKNQEKIDRGVRENAADTAHANKKLDRLLELGGVTERIPRPEVKPSELKRVPHD